MKAIRRKSEGGEMVKGREEKGMAQREEGGVGKTMERFWRELERVGPWAMLRQMPAAMGGMGQWPALDVAEDEKAMTVRADVPGMDAKDVEVEVSGNLLTIRGQREDEWTESKAGVHRRERKSGSFVRTVTLPAYVESDKIEARYEKGMLTITVPKRAGAGGAKKVNVTG